MDRRDLLCFNEGMIVRVRRVDKELPLPEYKTGGAVAFDLVSRVSMTILPRGVAYIPLNVAIEIPKGYMIMLAARSSLHKKGLMLANGVGIIDEDFCGNDDEYHAALYNFTEKPVSIERGARLLQGIIKKYEKADWQEVHDLENPTRGGFGSTDENEKGP